MVASYIHGYSWITYGGCTQAGKVYLMTWKINQLLSRPKVLATRAGIQNAERIDLISIALERKENTNSAAIKFSIVQSQDVESLPLHFRFCTVSSRDNEDLSSSLFVGPLFHRILARLCGGWCRIRMILRVFHQDFDFATFAFENDDRTWNSFAHC